MQYLRRAWNSWMNLDLGAWEKRIPEPLLWIMVSVVLGIWAIVLFGIAWNLFDLRHPLQLGNTAEPAAWLRVLQGCFYTGSGLLLTFVCLLIIQKSLPNPRDFKLSSPRNRQ